MSRYLWTQKEDIGPSGRFGHAMTYDSSRSRTILFGGARDGSAAFSDTWEWNGEFWTQIADIGPGSRQDHALCFDSIRNTALLFGGLAPAQGQLGDTWSWNGQDWTQLEDSGPPARSGHAMVFDSARGRAVLFGGISTTGLFNDTWEWDGQALAPVRVMHMPWLTTRRAAALSSSVGFRLRLSQIHLAIHGSISKRM
jgi:Kelch motif